MQYILLIAPRPFELSQLDRVVPEIAETVTGPGGDFLLRGTTPDQDIRLFPLGADCSDWAGDQHQMAQIEAVGSAREIYAVHFKDVERLKATLCGLVAAGGFIVDDDHDLFITGEEFVSLCKGSPGSNHWWLGGHSG